MARKGDIVHYVNNLEPYVGLHLAAMVVKASNDHDQRVNLDVRFEDPSQNPNAETMHLAAFRPNIVYSAELDKGTWHERTDCEE